LLTTFAPAAAAASEYILVVLFAFEWGERGLLSTTEPTSGAREDDELLGRPGHRDVAVDRSFDASAERLWVDEDDQVELEPLRQLRCQ
jgi:hypothetical protein